MASSARAVAVSWVAPYVVGFGCLVGGVLAAAGSVSEGAGSPPGADVHAPAPAESARGAPPVVPLPERLSETGLYAPGSTTEVSPLALFYVPQYPLWTDGAAKRRWVLLPRGSRIDASNPDVWQYPVGTRFFKEFSFGSRVETRFVERLPDGGYRYATYIWSEDRGDAFLSPDVGVRGVAAIAAGLLHDVPSEADCRACHEGKRSPILGFGALQLSPERDPLAPHAEPTPPEAIDLDDLVGRGLLENLPASFAETAPRIAAPNAVARAAAGYLFGNCSGCHNAEGPLSDVGLDLDQSVTDGGSYERVRSSLLSTTTHFRLPGQVTSSRVRPGEPAQSALVYRVRSRAPVAQMPPLGTKVVDAEAASLIEAWIESQLY